MKISTNQKIIITVLVIVALAFVARSLKRPAPGDGPSKEAGKEELKEIKDKKVRDAPPSANDDGPLESK